eukprot:gene3273-13297_t
MPTFQGEPWLRSGTERTKQNMLELYCNYADPVNMLEQMVRESGTTVKQSSTMQGLFSIFRPSPNDKVASLAKIQVTKDKPISVPKKLLKSLGLMRQKRSATPAQPCTEVISTEDSDEYNTGAVQSPTAQREQDVRRGSAYESRHAPPSLDYSCIGGTQCGPSPSGSPQLQPPSTPAGESSAAGSARGLQKDPKLSDSSLEGAEVVAPQNSGTSSSYTSSRNSPLTNECEEQLRKSVEYLRSSLGRHPRAEGQGQPFEQCWDGRKASTVLGCSNRMEDSFEEERRATIVHKPSSCLSDTCHSLDTVTVCELDEDTMSRPVSGALPSIIAVTSALESGTVGDACFDSWRAARSSEEAKTSVQGGPPSGPVPEPIPSLLFGPMHLFSNEDGFSEFAAAQTIAQSVEVSKDPRHAPCLSSIPPAVMSPPTPEQPLVVVNSSKMSDTPVTWSDVRSELELTALLVARTTSLPSPDPTLNPPLDALLDAAKSSAKNAGTREPLSPMARKSEAMAILRAPASPTSPHAYDAADPLATVPSFRVRAPPILSTLSAAKASPLSRPGSVGSDLGIFANLVHSRQSSQPNLVLAASRLGTLASKHNMDPTMTYAPSTNSLTEHCVISSHLGSGVSPQTADLVATSPRSPAAHAPPPAKTCNMISISETKKAQKVAFDSQLADQASPRRLAQVKSMSMGQDSHRAASRCTSHHGSPQEERSFDSCSSRDLPSSKDFQGAKTERMGSMLRTKLRNLVEDQVEARLRRQRKAGNGQGRVAIFNPPKSSSPVFSMDWTRSPVCNSSLGNAAGKGRTGKSAGRQPVQQTMFIPYRCASHGVQDCSGCLAQSLSTPPVDDTAVPNNSQVKHHCDRIDEETDLLSTGSSDGKAPIQMASMDGSMPMQQPAAQVSLADGVKQSHKMATSAYPNSHCNKHVVRRSLPTRAASTGLLGAISPGMSGGNHAWSEADQARDLKNTMQQADLDQLMLKFSQAEQGHRKSSVMTMFEPHNLTLSEREQYGGHQGANKTKTTPYRRQHSSIIC